MKFQEGDKVFKPKGYYFSGEVRGVITKLNGDVRVIVELINNEPSKNGDGMLHIFSEDQLQKV